MKKELNKKFNEEMTRYKETLFFYAKKCDWESFKDNAGRLFDYVESIERLETERRFFNVSKVIVAILFPAVLAIMKVNPQLYPGFEKIKDQMIIIAIGGCCFEVYFFYTFRKYMQGKSVYYNRRKARFIRNIEEDFRDMSLPGSA
jgi:hypothetical protein